MLRPLALLVAAVVLWARSPEEAWRDGRRSTFPEVFAVVQRRQLSGLNNTNKSQDFLLSVMTVIYPELKAQL